MNESASLFSKTTKCVIVVVIMGELPKISAEVLSPDVAGIDAEHLDIEFFGMDRPDGFDVSTEEDDREPHVTDADYSPKKSHDTRANGCIQEDEFDGPGEDSSLSQSDWMKRGRCVVDSTVEADVFIRPLGETIEGRRLREKEAKKICSSCVVQEECLDYGLKVDGQTSSDSAADRRYALSGSLSDVYGGMNGKERRAFARKTRQKRTA